MATRPRANGRPTSIDVAMKHQAAAVRGPGGASHVSARSLSASHELDSAIRTTTDVRDTITCDPLRRPFLSAAIRQDLSLVRCQVDADNLRLSALQPHVGDILDLGLVVEDPLPICRPRRTSGNCIAPRDLPQS